MNSSRSTPFLLLFALIFQSLLFNGAARAEQTKPNILLIITDDQRFDDLDGVMPQTKEEIFDQGVRFTRGYVTTPACNPSRASIFTGQYTSRHKAYTNRFPLESDTFVTRLKNEGDYFTGLVGKFMNTWNGTPREEFDYWVSFGGGSSKYKNPILNVNGKWQLTKGYMTTLLEEYALDFFEAAHKGNKPWFLALPYNAPHLPLSLPNTETPKLPTPQPPSFQKNYNNLPHPAPAWLKNKKPFSAAKKKSFVQQRKEQRKALQLVDQSLDRIFSELKRKGSFKDTLIFFLSDNGLFFGEHRLQSKDAVYEEAIKVPFAIRAPGEKKAAINESLVANIDIGPTIFDYAGIKKPWDMDGISLKPLLDGNTSQTASRTLFIEGFRRAGPRNAFSALHDGKTVFVTQHYIGKKPSDFELYELPIDPYQLSNRIHDTHVGSDVARLKSQLVKKLQDLRGSQIVTLPKEKRLPAKLTGPTKKQVMNLQQP